MADVEVYDADYVEALEASVVIGGAINAAGQLVLERGNGQKFNAGQVVPSLDVRWPMGSVYMSFESTDPATVLGGGVWTRLKDRMLIGVGDNPRWDAAGEVGGAETVALSEANLPAHDHEYQRSNPTFLYLDKGSETDIVTVFNTPAEYEAPTGLVGSGTAHENMPPFQSVYMWRRTG